MGTRGIVGFRLDGKDKLSYSHFDSYPECLGATVVNFVKSVDPITLLAQVKVLKPVPKRKPNAEEIKRLAEFTDLKVSEQSTSDWYCLLRETQGEPEAILKSGFFSDSKTFIRDSLFCEYAYIINLDEGTLEMYRGFQAEKHNKGRYGKRGRLKGEKYYPCALVATFPLDSIPDDWEAKAFPSEDDEE